MFNKFYNVWIYVLFLSLICIYILSTVGYIEGSDVLVSRFDRVVSLASLAYFFFLTVFALSSKNLYVLILPIVINSVPNAVNSIVPSFPLNPDYDVNVYYFSFVSHIDIYLLLGVIVFRNDLSSKFFHCKEVLLISSLLFVSLIVSSIICVINGESFLFILNSSFQFRYMILLLIISPVIFCRQKQFILGLSFSVILLIFESVMFTISTGRGLFELTSGNFGNNVLGSYLGALFCSILIYYKSCVVDKESRSYKLVLLTCLIFLFFGIVFTMVKAAIATTIGILFIYTFNSRDVIYKLLLIISSLSVFLVLFLKYFNINEINQLLDSITYIIKFGYDPGNININAENSSVLTRFELWRGTVNMIYDYPIFGIGTNTWNFIKDQYEIPFNILLDPHNDYLYLIVVSGVFAGSVQAYLFYFRPFLSFILKKNISFPSVFLAFYAVASISNASSSKHQTFAILVIFLLFYYSPSINKVEKGEFVK